MATFGNVSKSDVELWRGIQSKSERIAFNHWVPNAGDGLHPLSSARGWARPISS